MKRPSIDDDLHEKVMEFSKDHEIFRDVVRRWAHEKELKETAEATV